MGESRHISRDSQANYISDTYDIVLYKPLLPSVHVDPGTYDTAGVRELDRESEIEDICDFIVEYILSDVLVRFMQNTSSITDNNVRGYFLTGISSLQVCEDIPFQFEVF